jgi:hypothetical protein
MKSWLGLGIVLVVMQASLFQYCFSQTAVVEGGKTTEDKEREQLQSDLRAVLGSWASAWQSQFDDVYLLHYHPDFLPEDFVSLEAWKAARRARVKDPGTISIALKEFELVAARGDTAFVKFWLIYSRPGYADRTHKEMKLRLQGHIWMIEREHNLQVIKLPPP